MTRWRALRLGLAVVGTVMAGRSFLRHLRKLEREIGCWPVAD
jgi:hypothetical protein